MTNPLAQDLGGVVRLLEKATPGDWPEPEASRFVPDKFNVGDGAPYMLAGRDENDLRAAVASVNFLRAHSAEIAGALRDAERWQPIESAPRTGIAVLLWKPWKSGRDCTTIGHYANGWCDRFNEEMTPEPTHWRPLPAPPTQDSAMQQGGGGGE